MKKSSLILLLFTFPTFVLSAQLPTSSPPFDNSKGEGGPIILAVSEGCGTLYESSNTSDNNEAAYQDVYWKAQTFTPSVTHTVLCLSLKLWSSVANPDTVTASIRAVDGNGKPTGEDLASGSIDGSTITESTPGEWYEFDLGAGTTLTASTKYAIVLRSPSSVNDTWWRYGPSSYSGGSAYGSGDSGSTWSDIYAGNDFMFEEYGEVESPPETPVSAQLNFPMVLIIIGGTFVLCYLIEKGGNKIIDGVKAAYEYRIK